MEAGRQNDKRRRSDEIAARIRGESPEARELAKLISNYRDPRFSSAGTRVPRLISRRCLAISARATPSAITATRDTSSDLFPSWCTRCVRSAPTPMHFGSSFHSPAPGLRIIIACANLLRRESIIAR